MEKVRKNIRLPGHIKPIRYEIMLKPDLKEFFFKGEETIELEIKKPVKEITLHSYELKIERAELLRGRERTPAEKISYDPDRQTVSFHFPHILKRGLGKLHLVFEGVLGDAMQGFYRSKYLLDGKEHYMATTQFEATAARRAFPCVDEPGAKAVFDITLMVPGDETAISNTLPIKVKKHESGYKIVQFAPTPKMSTYLVACIIGQFDFIEAYTKEGVLVRVFVTSGKKQQAEFALDAACRTLSFYNKYFGIPYPLSKLDLIAIPDFAAGAMENWGAVTYRESALLIDPENSSRLTKQWVALVIAHELAHQWFGNLVTMEWWTHLWLNEGFASYIEYVAVDHLFPEWKIWTQFVSSDHAAALHLDALKSTHPIEVEVHDPDEIGEIFDAVSYSKGASIIRMLAEYLGEEKFREGLRHYLHRHSYANASTGDLWFAFERVSKKPVRKIMQTWTKKPGYPLVSLTSDKDGLLLRQSRFFASSFSREKNRSAGIWPIPISLLSAEEKNVKPFLMEKKSLRLANVFNGQWLKLNPREIGVFRAAYPKEYLALLRPLVGGKKLAPEDRLGLIRDIFALAEAGESSTHEALAFAQAYCKETEFAVWVELAWSVAQISSLIFEESFHPTYRLFARKLFQNVARRVGWTKKKGEDHSQALLRGLALSHAGAYGDLLTIKQAKRLFLAYLKRGRLVDADLRGTVYFLASRYGGTKEHKAFIELYKKETMAEERGRLGRALGAFPDKNLLLATLDFSLSGDVRPQDSVGILGGVWANPWGRRLAWEFVKKHWSTFVKRYGAGGHLLPRVIEPAGNFSDKNFAKDIENFFKKNKAPGAQRTIEQVLERIYSNDLWLKRDRRDIGKWLKKYVSTEF